ncbi:MAG: hypothetical protein EPO21_11345 [Chloroflexota bacterium]|nr:MAG: hypothetical protein EPO21_11345 [Chloroflexota bacterium]
MARPRRKLGIILLAITLVLGLLPGASNAASIKWDKIDPALRALMDQNPDGTYSIIVEGATPAAQRANLHSNIQRAGRAAESILTKKGRPLATLGIIGGVAAAASYSTVASLSRDPFVAYIHYDAPVRATADPIDKANVWEQVVKATDAWDLGYTGKGVGVAVLDSGISSATDLTRPNNRVIARANLVGDSPTTLDPGGHGTHVAGIIAGDGYSAPADARSTYSGVAPDANLIDVRVLGSDGTTSLSTVIRGVQWTIQNRNLYNIRVMNLSLGAVVPSNYTYATDPLVAALDIAWLSGIVVVAAAGNSGPTAGTINTPGTGPMLITVGALDDNMTSKTGDDGVATFSSRGPTPDGYAKPDLIAPGRRIISLRAPGSYLDRLLPDRIMTTTVGSTYFRLSGTSMSTPIVAGTAALLIQKNPSLKPDQVKFILADTSRHLEQKDDANIVGAGVLDAHAAVNSNITGRANLNKRPADGFARAILPLLKGQPLTWRDTSYAGRTWTNITWDNITWDNITWDNILWDNITWDNITWDNITWDNITWDNITWDNITWDNDARDNNERDKDARDRNTRKNNDRSNRQHTVQSDSFTGPGVTID